MSALAHGVGCIPRLPTAPELAERPDACLPSAGRSHSIDAPHCDTTMAGAWSTVRFHLFVSIPTTDRCCCAQHIGYAPQAAAKKTSSRQQHGLSSLDWAAGSRKDGDAGPAAAGRPGRGRGGPGEHARKHGQACCVCGVGQAAVDRVMFDVMVNRFRMMRWDEARHKTQPTHSISHSS